MSSTGFPINDLLRRKLQTSLTITTLTLSVASTLFLLLFSNRLGVGIASTAGTLTLGLTAIFSQFIFFIGVLIFLIGAVLTSFIVFLMMSQRTRDFGLIKAAGCPNSLVGGYFMTELLAVTLRRLYLGHSVWVFYWILPWQILFFPLMHCLIFGIAPWFLPLFLF